MQTVIVAIILTVTLALTVRHYYRRLTGKENGCNCCSKNGGGECHCKEHCESCSTQ